jgi:hypothetical protein
LNIVETVVVAVDVVAVAVVDLVVLTHHPNVFACFPIVQRKKHD